MYITHFYKDLRLRGPIHRYCLVTIVTTTPVCILFTFLNRKSYTYETCKAEVLLVLYLELK